MVQVIEVNLQMNRLRNLIFMVEEFIHIRMVVNLKEIGKIAEFNSMHKIIQLKGSKKTENSYPLHELMSSHMARRSFISNLIEEGAPSWAIMAQTGHVSEKSFKKYIDIRKDFKKAEMNRVFTR